MFFFSFLFTVFSSTLFLILGFLFGIIVLFSSLIIGASQPIRKSNRPNIFENKNKRSDKEDNDEQIFQFEDSVQLEWMNKLLWRSYPLLLDRRLIKEKIMEALVQIPKDIPAIGNLTLTQFEIALTPPVLDSASIHQIPKEEIDKLQNPQALDDDVDDDFDVEAFMRNPSQKEFASGGMSLFNKVTKSNQTLGTFATSFLSNRNQNSPTQQSQHQTMKTKPLNFISSLTDCNDYLKFCFHFEPELEIGAKIKYALPILGTIDVGAQFRLHSFQGHFVVGIPPKTGDLKIAIHENTNINFDITAQLGKYAVKSEEFARVWNSLKQWIHTYLHRMVIKVPLEETLRNVQLSLEDDERLDEYPPESGFDDIIENNEIKEDVCHEPLITDISPNSSPFKTISYEDYEEEEPEIIQSPKKLLLIKVTRYIDWNNSEF